MCFSPDGRETEEERATLEIHRLPAHCSLLREIETERYKLLFNFLYDLMRKQALLKLFSFATSYCDGSVMHIVGAPRKPLT